VHDEVEEDRRWSVVVGIIGDSGGRKEERRAGEASSRACRAPERERVRGEGRKSGGGGCRGASS
jgi:hypothetical protein